MNNKNKQLILDYLESREEPTTMKDILSNIHLSYPTLSKYLLVLEAEGKIRISDYGNIKFYYTKNGK